MDARMGVAGFRLTAAPYEHAMEDDVRGVTFGESASKRVRDAGRRMAPADNELTAEGSPKLNAVNGPKGQGKTGSPSLGQTVSGISASTSSASPRALGKASVRW
jgi:hypothetical protein